MATLHAVLHQHLMDGHAVDLSLTEDQRALRAHVLTEQLGLVAFDPAVPAELLVAIPDVLHDDDAQLVAVVGELGLLPPVGAAVVIESLQVRVLILRAERSQSSPLIRAARCCSGSILGSMSRTLLEVMRFCLPPVQGSPVSASNRPWQEKQ